MQTIFMQNCPTWYIQGAFHEKTLQQQRWQHCVQYCSLRVYFRVRWPIEDEFGCHHKTHMEIPSFGVVASIFPLCFLLGCRRSLLGLWHGFSWNEYLRRENGRKIHRVAWVLQKAEVTLRREFVAFCWCWQWSSIISSSVQWVEWQKKIFGRHSRSLEEQRETHPDVKPSPWMNKATLSLAIERGCSQLVSV